MTETFEANISRTPIIVLPELSIQSLELFDEVTEILGTRPTILVPGTEVGEYELRTPDSQSLIGRQAIIQHCREVSGHGNTLLGGLGSPWLMQIDEKS